jgi:hypothetical protein
MDMPVRDAWGCCGFLAFWNFVGTVVRRRALREMLTGHSAL